MIKSKMPSLFFLIMLIPGIAMLFGSGNIIKDNIQLLSNSLKAQGTVIGILSESSDNRKFYYAPKVSFYDLNKQEITFDSMQFSNSNNKPVYSIGESVSVIYDKANPKNAQINSFSELWLVATLLLFLGLIFTTIGFGAINSSILLPIRDNLLKKKLINNGSKITAKVTSVDIDVYTITEATHMYVITAQWLNPKDNKVYVFKSENLTYNPTGMIKNNEISVYIDPEMPQKYYVDVSALPEAVN